MERSTDETYLVPIGPLETEPPLPAGVWRIAQQKAMREAAATLAPNGELLCWSCVEPVLVEVAEAVPPLPEPPRDPIDRLQWFAERQGQFEQDDLAHYDADSSRDPMSLVLSDPDFAARFGARLYGRLPQCECERGHRYFDTEPVRAGDSGKSSAYSSLYGNGDIEGEVKGVQSRDSVDAEGRFWRCIQSRSFGKPGWFRGATLRVEWQCSPLPLTEKAVRRAFQAFFERPAGFG